MFVKYPEGKRETYFNPKLDCSIDSESMKEKDEERADVMGAHLAGPWTQSVGQPPPVREGHRQVDGEDVWPHQREGITIPMPTGSQLANMITEAYQRVKNSPVGPVTAAWREGVFAWARKLRVRLFGDSPQVTGLWSKAKDKFRVRLNLLHDKQLVEKVMKEVERGVRLPFEKTPAAPIIASRNHKDLSLRSGHVYDALCTQLLEGSVQAFNMHEGSRPMGILALRWVEKSNPEEVRLTLNGRPENPLFPYSECTIVLETHRELRSHYTQGQWHVGYDLHNGFFNQQYVEEDRKWVCFRIHETELQQCHVADLKRRFPTSWVGGYIYFNYVGLVMGLSPSCQQLQRVNETMLRVWRRFKVRKAEWDATSYIDDLMAWIRGSFEGAIELALRLLAEQVCLGFSVNLNHKTTIVPHTYYNHIGVVVDSARMRFSLPPARVRKMAQTVQSLFLIVKVGQQVPAKLVARFVGQLWAASIVCYRAVALMARAMIRTLATMINTSKAMDETDPGRLRYILRRVWGGNVLWTQEAQEELEFWMAVNFALLSAPISHDRWAKGIEQWVLNPSTGKIASDVKVFAVDTSNSMSGGGEFFREGELWRLVKGVAVRLTPEEVLTSSTFRELLGVLRLDLAIIPASCKKAVVALDSQAAVACLLHGSKVKALNDLVRRIFARQLKYNRVLWPVWVRRSESIIVQCDERSRLVDNHTFAVAPSVFWKANVVAKRLWGRGFQVDVCADLFNVQPGDSSAKLPFYSRWFSPHATATDMLQQDWTGLVNWCNPPFSLLPRVVALVQAQGAVAAVLAPHDPSARWFRKLRACTGCVLYVLPVSVVAGRSHAVFFLDFTKNPPSSSFKDYASAEDLAKPLTSPPSFHSLVVEGD